MIGFFIYLLKAALGLALAHLLYRFFLRKHTKFQANRFFLLLMIALSLGFPFLQISVDIARDTPLAKGITYVESLESGWGETEILNATLLHHQKNPANNFYWPLVITALYVIGLLICALPVLNSWNSLIRLISSSKKHKAGGFIWLDSPDSHSFSAFQYIFLSNELSTLPEKDQNRIIRHEKVHASQWHSLDLLFLDLIRIVFWFHPLKNSLKKDVQELHECIADSTVVRTENKHEYSRLIVQLTQKERLPLPIHSFAYSPIKHRIIMLLKTPTHSFKYLIIPALCACSFVITMACTFEMAQVEEILTNKSATADNPDKRIGVVATQDGVVINHTSLLQEEKQEEVDFIFPLEGEIVSAYGMRMHPVQKVRKMHFGLDFRAETGTPVKATAAGEVILINDQKGGYGKQIELKHSGGFVSKYAQLSAFKVEKGQKIKQGEIIALTGNSGASTGPHLHFELMKDKAKVDPEKYLKK